MESKIRIGVSACLVGRPCNFNGKDLLSEFVKRLPEIAPIEFVSFCPEDYVFGTPRPNLMIVGGDGNDVLDGKATVVNEVKEDVTAQQISGAQKFLEHLLNAQVSHAILMDGSPSCGSNVLLSEVGWPTGGFKRGVGVASALLRRNGIKVFSSFDERTISEFLNSTLEGVLIHPGRGDLRENPKFKVLFES